MAITDCLRPKSAPLACALGLGAALAAVAPLQAAMFAVTNTKDSGPGSLRQQVLLANANPGSDTIRFDSNVVGTILLTSGTLSVTDPLTLKGPGRDVLTLDGGGVATILQVEDSLSIARLKLDNAGGSAINGFFWYSYDPRLIIESCLITGSAGAGISLDGTNRYAGTSVIVSDSTIAGNLGDGVAIAVTYQVSGSASMTIQDSVISGNSGNGISAYASGVSLKNTTVSGNTDSGLHAPHGDVSASFYAEHSVIADNGGSGISGAGYSHLKNSTIASNRGAGLSVDFRYYGGGGANLEGCTIEGNQGGGVFGGGGSYNQEEDALKISNSTITNNAGTGVGHFAAGRLISIRNSTITGNKAGERGGGIYVSDSMYGTSSVVVENSIVAGNVASADPDVATADGTFTVDYSLIQDPGSAVFTETVPGSNIIGKAPMLGVLADNGGLTQTHVLLPGSLAIDSGDPNFKAPPDFDQRGAGFERVVNGRIDMGAFEVQEGEVPAVDAWLRSLGDTTRDGTPEIAVVTRVDGKNLATVKDAGNGALISQFEFSAALRPVDVKVMEDLGFGYGYGLAANLVLLGGGPAEAETRDALTGDLLGAVTFSLSFSPVDLAVLPDQNGNGIPELAMLATGSTKVEVRDAVTGNLVNSLWFDEQLEPRQVLALPDLNGNGSAEVGVVLCKDNQADRVVVKDTRTRAWVKTLWSGADLLQAEQVADRNRNGAPEVAMLWRDPAPGDTHVWVVDAATGLRVASLAGFNKGFTPLKLVVVADVTGNGVEEYAVLGRKSETGQVAATILDGATSQWVNRIWFNTDCTPLDLVSIADINGNGAEELVMLGRCGTEGQLRAFVKDAKTGELLREMRF